MKRMKKARCADCRHFRLHTGEPVGEKGVTLKSGERYCMAEKRPRRFRPGDPKIYPPKWCPAKISPPILRIYEMRYERRLYHEIQKKNDQHDRTAYRPSPEHFVLRLTGTAPMEARGFYKEVCEIRRYECYLSLTTVGDLLGVKVREDEIVKFDDGILPVYFYVDEGPSGTRIRQIFRYGDGISDE